MKKRWMGLALSLAMVLALLLTGCGGQSAVEARNGVARVLTMYEVLAYDRDTMELVGSLGTNASVGSAFGVGDQGEETDVFVTNRHVVTGDTYLGEASGVVYIIEERVTGIYILLDNYAYNRTTGELDTSRSIPCTMIYQGETEADDVAVLRTAEPVPGRVALALQDSEDTLGLSDPVTAIGYPLLSDTNTNEGYLLASVDDATITDGTVARFFDSVSISAEETLGRVIQHTADINGGNSGGPLVDANGIVVGVNTWVGNDGDQFTTTSYYALRIQYAKNALDSLGIHYDVASGFPTGVVIAVVVMVVLVLAGAGVFLAKKKGVTMPIPKRKAGGHSKHGAAPQELRIHCVSGVFAGRKFEITGQLRMGRDPSRNALVFPAQTQGVSGVHCLLTMEGDKLYLQDLGSSYGTWLADGRRLSASQAVELKVGDSFSLGSQRERFVVTEKGGV